MENPAQLKLPNWARAIVAILSTRKLTREDRRHLKRLHGDCTDASIEDFLQAYTKALEATITLKREDEAQGIEDAVIERITNG